MKQRQPSRRSTAERDALIAKGQGLVYFMIKRMMSLGKIRHMGYEDAIQTGFVALILAAEYWDETKGIQFSTYASRTIWNTIWTEDKGSGVVTVPRSYYSNRAGPYAEEARRADHMGSLPDWDLMSVDSPRVDTDDEIDVLLRDLPAEDRWILEAYFFGDETLAEIGRKLGVTRERIRQRKQLALERIREKRQGREEIPDPGS
jgi:RNA polymerase sigma factor (sigma-70 family)